MTPSLPGKLNIRPEPLSQASYSFLIPVAWEKRHSSLTISYQVVVEGEKASPEPSPE